MMTRLFALSLLAMMEPGGDNVLDSIAASGQCASLPDTPDVRIVRLPMIAPGPPPMLSFRSYQGKLRQRFGNGDLMLDDAGH